MLAGDFGPGVCQAMKIIVTLGRIYGARRLVPVGSVQVAGVSYRNLGEAGLEFLREWADQGARVRVPTTLNPAGMDLRAWRKLGFSEAFARQQLAVIEVYQRLGVRTTCTCTPYLVGNVPRLGEHVAWAESSAVSWPAFTPTTSTTSRCSPRPAGVRSSTSCSAVPRAAPSAGRARWLRASRGAPLRAACIWTKTAVPHCGWSCAALYTSFPTSGHSGTWSGRQRAIACHISWA